MKLICSLLALLGLLTACRSGDVELVAVENPEVVSPTDVPEGVRAEAPAAEPTALSAADDGETLDPADPDANGSEDLDDRTVVTGDELELGMVAVELDDVWCTAAMKVNDNYLTLNGLDRTDPKILEAAFRQIYDSLETTAQLAPAEIASEADVERWVWDRMITIHDDANWDLSALPIEQVKELDLSNLDAMLAVDDFTEQQCG